MVILVVKFVTAFPDLIPFSVLLVGVCSGPGSGVPG